MVNRSSNDTVAADSTAGVVLSGASSGVFLPARCPHCGMANSTERKFCASCGRGLWEPCLHCNALQGAWERFCGVCGSNLEALVREQVDHFELHLQQASALAADGEHAAAIEQLQRVSSSDHPRLVAYARRFQEVIETLQADLQRLELDREEHFRRAQRFRAELQYEQAQAELERIPRRMRLPEMQNLLDEVRSILQELPALEAEISEAVAERRTQEILPRVQRFLELRPNHAAMGELGKKLGDMQQRQMEVRRKQLIAAAKLKLAAYEYAAAARLVEQIHASVRTADVEKFFEYCQNRAREVAWLTEDLRDCALFDEHVPQLAERLHKLRPADAATSQLIQRVKRLSERHSAAPVGQRRYSIVSKTPSHTGMPINVLEGFRYISDESIRQCEAYTTNYTSFYVASGLALQGLHKAAVPVNLLPGQKKSLLGLAAAALRRRPKSAWGINLGISGLKAIRLALDEQGPPKDPQAPSQDNGQAETRAVALACEYIPYSQLLTMPDASPETLIREALQKFLESHSLADDTVCVSYPASKSLVRLVSLPPAEKKKLPELVKFEARQQIPFPLESVTWDYCLMGGDADAGSPQDIAMVAIKSEEAQQFLYPLEELKIKVDVLQPEHVALHNYMAWDQYAAFLETSDDDETSLRNRVVAVLDLGAASSNLLVGNAQTMWMRNMPLGSQHFNRPLITEFRLTQDQAEQLKRRPTLAAFVSKSWQAMEPLLRDFASELQRSLASFEHSDRQRKLTQLLVVGGGIRMHGLLRALRQGAAH